MSAKFGLLDADDVIGPYDVYLADQSRRYRKAWGEFVVAQLEQNGSRMLRGRIIEVHAGAAYVEPLREPLAARGAALATPLARLRQGEQLAWYNSIPRETSHQPAEAHPNHRLTSAGARQDLVGSRACDSRRRIC